MSIFAQHCFNVKDLFTVEVVEELIARDVDFLRCVQERLVLMNSDDFVNFLSLSKSALLSKAKGYKCLSSLPSALVAALAYRDLWLELS